MDTIPPMRGVQLSTVLRALEDLVPVQVAAEWFDTLRDDAPVYVTVKLMRLL